MKLYRLGDFGYRGLPLTVWLLEVRDQGAVRFGCLGASHFGLQTTAWLYSDSLPSVYLVPCAVLSLDKDTNLSYPSDFNHH